MSSIQITLKLNALSCILFGALFVLQPEMIIQFLSIEAPMPKAVMLVLGVMLNLNGLFLLWLASMESPPKAALKFAIAADVAWVVTTIVLVLLQAWVTTIPGITAAGMVAIMVGWFAQLQWQHLKQR